MIRMKPHLLGFPPLLQKPNSIPFPSFTLNNIPYLSDTSTKLSTTNSIPISQSLFTLVQDGSNLNCLINLQANIFASGLKDSSFFLGTKLANSHRKFGSLTESKSVSGKIVNYDESLVGYFRKGQYRQVLERYRELRGKVGIILVGSVITSCLKSCAELGCLGFGELVHVDAIKLGLSVDRFVGSALVKFYSQCGDIGDAWKVFVQINQKDVVAYTSMITGYSHLGDGRAFAVAQDMMSARVNPNRVTLVSLLQAAAALGEYNVGRSIHGFALRRSIGCPDDVFETSLGDMYVKCGVLGTAVQVIAGKETQNVGSWNAVIGGHLQIGKALEAFRLFSWMLREAVVPDLISLANGILSCAELMYLREGKSIQGYICRTGMELDLVVMSALIDLYSKCGKLKQACELFNRMDRKDIVSYNVMMGGYIKNGFPGEAIRLYSGMLHTGLQPNVASFVTALSALCDLKAIRQGMTIHGSILKHGLDVNMEIANQLIGVYSKCGLMNYAVQVFCSMKSRDLISWTSMIMGYANHGRSDAALSTFRLMQKENIVHDSITLMGLLQVFSQTGCLNLAREVHAHLHRTLQESDMPVLNSLINAYAKCGRLDMARVLFERMDERCLTSWNTMIAAYGMHGLCPEALKLYEEMQRMRLQPDGLTLTSLLMACSHSGFIEEGLHIFKSMIEKHPITPCEEHYICIVDLLGRSGQIREAHDLVKFLPLREGSAALRSLLAACRVYIDTEMGESIVQNLLDLASNDSSSFTSMANLYAAGERWDEVARIRSILREKGLIATVGFSRVEL